MRDQEKSNLKKKGEKPFAFFGIISIHFFFLVHLAVCNAHPFIVGIFFSFRNEIEKEWSSLQLCGTIGYMSELKNYTS